VAKERAPHPELAPGMRAGWFRTVLEAWNEGVLEIDDSLAHPEFRLYSMMMGGWVGGAEGMRAFLDEIRQQFEDFNFALKHCEELREDRLLALGTLRFRGRGSGVEMDMDVGWILTFRDGLVWRWRNYLSHEEALADAEGPGYS
jgi:ketosteroid isomerase-like protein